MGHSVFSCSFVLIGLMLSHVHTFDLTFILSCMVMTGTPWLFLKWFFVTGLISFHSLLCHADDLLLFLLNSYRLCFSQRQSFFWIILMWLRIDNAEMVFFVQFWWWSWGKQCPSLMIGISWIRSCRGCHIWMIQGASAVSHILIQILLTFAVIEAPSLCHLVSVSVGYLAWDERNTGSGGTVGKPNWVHLGLETWHTTVRHIRLS